MAKQETKYGAQLAVKVTPAMLDALAENAETIGSTKEIIVRDLVRAFNDFCQGGRRPVLPVSIASPGFRIVKGRIVDATPTEYPEAEARDLQAAEESPEFAARAIKSLEQKAGKRERGPATRGDRH